MLTAQPKPISIPGAKIVAGAGSRRGVAGKSASFRGFRRKTPSVKAVISSGDGKTRVEVAEKLVEIDGSSPSSAQSSGDFVKSGGDVKARAVITVRKKMNERLTEKIEDQWESFINGIGRGISLQLISEDVDPVTKSAKTVESFVRGWLPKLSSPYVVQYGADFTVPKDFGQPGAVLITNSHDKEFFLVEIVVQGFSQGPFFFRANTWIHSKNDNPQSRIIFRNQAYLPSQTPPGIKDLRLEELSSLRGDGKGERKLHERIYDYDVYNDLGNPDKKGEDLVRPVLGGTEEWPYPRRCRTGRKPTKTDPNSETRKEKPLPVYVPRDETFEETKQKSFSAGRLRALFHNLIPLIVAKLASSDVPFTSFSDIDNLYNDDELLKDLENEDNKNKFFSILTDRVFNAGNKLFKYTLPAIVKRDRFSWLRDNEFARQMLAGVNPVNIELLREFPIMSKLDPEIYGPPESAITRELIARELQGISVEEAIKQKKLFILDYHDLLLPFLDKMNSLPDRKAYASRTIFHYSDKGILRPIVIELSLPPTPSSPRNKYIYTHGHDATTVWLWKLAKAHVCSNDGGVHQLVNHWLKTHASMEPYIIAAHRQLSSLHPIYKLLHPHMRYTMEINALARQNLINAGGVIEACFSPGKFAMEISSAAYKSLWRFDMESLPADLLRRGMGVEDPAVPGGVKLVIEDYPYASDGLLIWSAIKEMVESFVAHYYSEPNSIANDAELQAWWEEIKNEGHKDKKDEPWWPSLKTQDDLSGILSTMIWTASCQHAAINFGQYPFGGYPPNRPTFMRKLIPQSGDPGYKEFLSNPEYTFLTSLPTQLKATKVMAVQDALSTHSPDEEYLYQLNEIQGQYFEDGEVRRMFEGLSVKLVEIERIINLRNKNEELKNRHGAGVPPYELLLPSSEPGVTARGIPNSISI